MKNSIGGGTSYDPMLYLQNENGTNVKQLYAHPTGSNLSPVIKSSEFDVSSYTGNHRLYMNIGTFGRDQFHNIGANILLHEASLS